MRGPQHAISPANTSSSRAALTSARVVAPAGSSSRFAVEPRIRQTERSRQRRIEATGVGDGGKEGAKMSMDLVPLGRLLDYGRGDRREAGQ